MSTTTRRKPAPIPAEWCTGTHFSAPVRAWMPWFVPSEWSSVGHRVSQGVSAARERDRKSDDPWTRARATGDLNKLGDQANNYAGRRA